MRLQGMEIYEEDTTMGYTGQCPLIYNPTKARFEIWQNGFMLSYASRRFSNQHIEEWIKQVVGKDYMWVIMNSYNTVIKQQNWREKKEEYRRKREANAAT